MNREDITRMAREAGLADCISTGWPEELERFFQAAYDAGAAAERNILAAWMIQFGFATGHGDTMEQLVDALGSEIVDRIEIEIDVAVAAERDRMCEQFNIPKELAHEKAKSNETN